MRLEGFLPNGLDEDNIRNIPVDEFKKLDLITFSEIPSLAMCGIKGKGDQVERIPDVAFNELTVEGINRMSGLRRRLAH